MHRFRTSQHGNNPDFTPILLNVVSQTKRTYKAPKNTQNNTNKACKVTKHVKLALFAQYCYIDDGRNGHDHPDIEILTHLSSSQTKAGENRLNQVFSRARGQLKSFAGAALIGSTLAMGSIPANADENPTTGNATVHTVASRSVDATPSPQLRETPYCAPLFKTETGREVNASFSAHDYSKKNIGKVGISIFAGQDLGQYSPEFLGTALVNSLLKRGVEAECFIHNETMPNGTGVDFKIAGLSWGKDQSLSISEALNKEMIDRVAAEAKTASVLLVSSHQHLDKTP